MSDSLRPRESQHTRPPCPSPTPRVYSNSCPSSWWCHPAISSSVVPFSSCPQSLPAAGSFPMSILYGIYFSLFFLWLTSLSIRLSVFIHVALNGKISFFLGLNNIPFIHMKKDISVYTYVYTIFSLSIHPSIDTLVVTISWLSWIMWQWPWMYKLSPQESDFISFGYILRSGTAGSYGRLLLIFWETSSLFSKMAVPSLHHQQRTRAPFSPHPHRYLFSLAFLIIDILTGERCYLIVCFYNYLFLALLGLCGCVV